MHITSQIARVYSKNKITFIGLMFLSPAMILYIFFMAYPLFDSFVLSFYSWTGMGDRVFVGFSNYLNMVDDTILHRALSNTVYLAFFSSIISVALGVLLAWLCLYVKRTEGQIQRTILFAPNMIAPTITGLLFLFVFTEDIGLLNNFLNVIGLGHLRVAWLSNPRTALPSILFITIWRHFGLALVLCFAGLQNMPAPLIESARLEGASEIRILRSIFLPLIKPMILLSLFFTMVGGLRIYDSVVSLTAGGPAKTTVVMPLWIFENAFIFSNLGYSSAISILFIVVVFIFLVTLQLVFRGEEYEL